MHFELIFVWAKRLESSFIPPHVDVQFPRTIFSRVFFFPVYVFDFIKDEMAGAVAPLVYSVSLPVCSYTSTMLFLS